MPIEKPMQYTENLFIWSNCEANVKQLRALKIFKIQVTLRAGSDPNCL